LRPHDPLPSSLQFPKRSSVTEVLDRVPIERPALTYRGPKALRDSGELVSAMQPYLSPGARVLDLGCGPRDQAVVFDHLRFNYVGIDFDSPAADIAADAHSIPFARETFDAVFSYAVLEHLHNPFLALSEVNRVLKPGGIYCGTVSQGEPFHSSFFHATAWGFISLVETSGMRIQRLWPSYDTLRALAVMGRYPRVIRLLLRAVDALHTKFPLLAPRKRIAWTERERMLDDLYRAASICFVVQKKP